MTKDVTTKVEIITAFAWYKPGDIADVSLGVAKRFIESKRAKAHVEKPASIKKGK